MASEEEVLEVTGYRIGTVSPFGLKNQIRVMLDASVLREEEISIGSGVRNTAILMKSEDVRKALGDVEIVELGKPGQT
jgi:Cys-tRNA(Pro)/Cys-tRNA(Cys) deacylase